MVPGQSVTIEIRVGDELPEPANTNWEAKPDWMTPGELMQTIRRARREMRQELAADASLWSCPKHRHFWESLNGLEAFTRWRYFREE